MRRWYTAGLCALGLQACSGAYGKVKEMRSDTIRGDSMRVLVVIAGESETADRQMAGRVRMQLDSAFAQLLEELSRLTRAGLVHADLSPFNVLWWGERMWLIDFPQAVDLVTNPHGFDLLHHDVVTMCTWFARQGIERDADELYAELLSEAW